MSEEYLEEACFYLAELGVSAREIGKQLSLTEEQVSRALICHKAKIASGKTRYDEDAKEFWSKNLQESRGDQRVTLVDDKGRYYHGWKSELEAMPTGELVGVLVMNKRYSDSHPLSGFSKGGEITGYDPLVPLRNIRKTVSLIEEILQNRENQR